MNRFGNVFCLIFTIVLLSWVALLISGGLPLKVFLVQSGSMEPSIMTGDVILVKESGFYPVNTVITFKDSTNRIVTHRIVESKRNKIFVTKGDANKDEDRENVREDQILGEVVLVVPKIGYLVNFLKTLPGLILFVFMPAIYLVVIEVRNIGKELRKRR